MAALETVETHLARVLGAIHPLPPVTVPLVKAHGRVLAGDLTSALEIPRFDNSAMDGYAVHFADVEAASPEHPVTLRVRGEVAAGSARDPRFGRGETVRILTGAPMPSAGDAVVPIEHTDGGDREVVITVPPRAGAHIRRAGEDVRVGHTVLRDGSWLDAAAIAAAAAAGRPTLSVHRSPRVAVVATGAELRAVGESLARGQIPDSNSYLVAGLCGEAGATVVWSGTVDDNPRSLAALLERFTPDEVDLVVLTGGVGPGHHDVVRIAFGDDAGFTFTHIAMQPGKPQGFGMLRGVTPTFGLPGNPVSVAVSFELFVRPVLLRLQGATHLQRPRFAVEVADSWVSPAGRLQIMPVVFLGSGERGLPRAQRATAGGSGSHLAGALAGASGYAFVPPTVTRVEPGDLLDAIRIGR